MVKRLTLIFSMLLMLSCGARKVAVVKEEIKTTTDSVATVKVDGTYTKENNITITNTTEEVEICPIVDSLPITVNGVQYKNVRIKTKKHIGIVIDTSKIKASKNVFKTVSESKSQATSIKTKAVDKKESITSTLIIWVFILFIIIIVGGVLYRLWKTYV